MPQAFVWMGFCLCVAVIYSIFSINTEATVYSQDFFACKEKILTENVINLSDKCLIYLIDQEINRFSSLNEEELKKEYKEFRREISNFSKFDDNIVNNIISSKKFINDLSNKSIKKEINYRYCKYIKENISLANEKEFIKKIPICNDYKNKYNKD